MPSADLVHYIGSVFQERETANGQTNHQDVARAIVGESSNLFPRLARSIRAMDMHPYLYPGAFSMVRSLAEDSNSSVIIWTQGNIRGQLSKIVTSGLASLRREVGRDNMEIFVAEDKITPISGLLDRLQGEGFKEFVILDDKPANIEGVILASEKWKIDHPDADINIVPILVNNGSKASLECLQIPSLANLADVYRRRSNVKTAYLVDFDHTIADSGEAKKRLFLDIASIIEEGSTILGSHKDDLLAGVF